ncbi:MAG: helix-turn-helix domain-containing protein [Roseibium sp.]|uniref:helix-turn-helix domain-containing protein n=1 Tax=Roseibium sp. TaxID=1936156 RepID=UPI003D9C4B98
MAGKRPNGRRIKSHRSYDVAEAARALGVAKGTVRRWLKKGLPSLNERRPILILGQDLKAFLDGRRKPKQTCRIDECLCMSCNAPRKPALDEVEFHPTTAGRGNMRALCNVCSTVMHKLVSAEGLKALKAILTVTIVQAETRLNDGNPLRSNDHFTKEPATHA